MVLRTLDLFGVDRAMFASNFPVDGLVARFETIYDGFRTIVRDLTATDQQKLFGENAVRIYRLDAPLERAASVGRHGAERAP